ncbi:hypothetical protein [Asanoa siamensis]|nr:hypothetical protein [Asanoa siamensis]
MTTGRRRNLLDLASQEWGRPPRPWLIAAVGGLALTALGCTLVEVARKRALTPGP